MQLIVINLLYIRYVQRVHITQEILSFFLLLVLYRSLVRKLNPILQAHGFIDQAQMLPQPVGPILSTTHVLHIPVLVGYALSVQLHLFHLGHLTECGLLLVGIEHEDLTSR